MSTGPPAPTIAGTSPEDVSAMTQDHPTPDDKPEPEPGSQQAEPMICWTQLLNEEEPAVVAPLQPLPPTLSQTELGDLLTKIREVPSDGDGT